MLLKNYIYNTAGLIAQKLGLGGGIDGMHPIFTQRDDVTSGGSSVLSLFAENLSGDARVVIRKSGQSSTQGVAHPAPQDTGWHCYAGALGSDDTLRLYIDSREVAKQYLPQTGDFSTSIDWTQIGRHSYNSNGNRSLFNGKIEFVEVHDCFLDPLQTCIDWLCQGFEGDLVIDSTTIAGCPLAFGAVDSFSYGTPPYNYTWSNGDTTSTTYFDTGTHHVIVTDSAGCMWTDTFEIQPAAGLAIDTIGSLCYGQNLTVKSTDTAGTFNKTWTITNATGNQTYTGDTIQIVLDAQGTYEIKLNYDLNTCSDSSTMNFSLDTVAGIKAIPQVNYFPGCSGAEVQADSLLGYAPFEINWSNNDTGVTTLYDTGIYTVTLTDSNLCTAIDTFQIQSGSAPSIDTVGPLCYGENLTIKSTDTAGIFQKSWTVTQAQDTQMFTGDTQQIQLTTKGTYQIQLNYSLNNCADSVLFTFSLDSAAYVKGVPEVNYFPGCEGAQVEADSIMGFSPVEIHWSNTDTGLTALYDTGSHYVQITDAGNCSYTDTFYVSPGIPLTIDTVGGLCLGENLLLKSSDTAGIFDKQWEVTNTAGSQIYTGDTFSIPLNAEGNYQIQLSYTKNNCHDTSYYNFDLDSAAGITAQPGVNFFPGCAGGEVFADSLSGYPPYQINWSNSDTGHTTLYDTGYHTVTITDAGNCTYTDTFYVGVDSVIAVSDTLLGCEGDTLLLNTSGNLTGYQTFWNVTAPNTTTTFGGNFFYYEVKDTGFYEFELQYSKHGCMRTSTVKHNSTVFDLAGSLNYETNYFPGCDGAQISTDTIVGGRPFYSVLWSNGDTNFHSRFDTGYHNITVADTVNCIWSDTFYVSPDTLTLDNQTVHLCPMDSIYLQSSDTADYLNKYWYIQMPDSHFTVNGDTLEYLMNTSGNYDFHLVYSKYNCSDTLIFSTQPDSVETDIQINTTFNFFPGCTGAEAYAVNPVGESPFVYNWSNTDSTASTLYDTGSHTITVIDDRGCEKVKNFTINSDSLQLNIELTPGCGTDTLFVFSDDTAGGFIKTITETTPQSASTTHTGDSLYFTVSDTGLYTYTLNYTKNGCARTTEITYIKTEFDLSVEASTELNYFPGCTGSEAQVNTVNGGRSPYRYLWSNNDTGMSTLLDTGYHTLTVFDTLNCSATDTFKIDAGTTGLIADTVHLCPFDSVYIQSTDQQGLFTKQWYITEPSGSNTLSGDSISSLLNTAGTYFFDFEYNRNGCSDTLTYSVEPDTLVTRAQTYTEVNYFPGCNGAQIYVDNLIGESPFQYQWSNNNTGQTALHDTGTWFVTVTDARNCTWVDTFNITSDSLTITIDTTLGCGSDTMYLQSNDFNGDFQKWWNITTPDSSVTRQGDSLIFLTSDSGIHEFEFNYSKYGCSRNFSYIYDVVNMDLPRNLIQIPPNVCEGDSFGIYIDDTAFINTIEWHAPSGNPVTLNNADTFYFNYPQAGNYMIEAHTNEWCKTDTHNYDIRIHPIPVADLGPDTLLCEGDSFIIALQDTTFDYAWNNGDTTNYLRVIHPDTYSVTITSAYCGYDTDTVIIDSVIPALVHLPPDTLMCEGDTLRLDAEVALGSYTWSTGDTTPQITVTQTGVYSVTSTNLCRSDWDTVSVDFTDLPIVDLGNDTLFCEGNTLTLHARGDTLSTYVWNDQSTDTILHVSQPGMYRVTATNLCGDKVEAINIRVADTPTLDLSPDTVLCPQDIYILDAAAPFARNYQWSTGATTSELQITTPGTYGVTYDHVCGTYADSVTVEYDNTPITDLGPDGAYCLGDLIELDATWSRATYLWNTGDRDSIITAAQEGDYWVQVTNLCGMDDDTIKLWFHIPINFDLGPDTSICLGETVTLTAEGLAANFLWNTGSTDSIITVNRQGIYSVRAENACGVFQDTVSIRMLYPPQYSFTPIDTACVGEELHTRIDRLNQSDLMWYDGSNRAQRTFTQTGSYGFSLENECGIIYDTAEAVFENYPELDLGSDTLLCAGEELELQAPNNLHYTYEWNTGTAQYNYTVTRGGYYRVTVSTPAGCAVEDDIRIADCGPQIFIPNAFSPNGDGLNDVFGIESVRLDKFWIRIFDRWGKELFFSENPDFEWDGTYRGKPVNEGVYSYRVWYRSGEYQSREKFGTITLLR